MTYEFIVRNPRFAKTRLSAAKSNPHSKPGRIYDIWFYSDKQVTLVFD